MEETSKLNLLMPSGVEKIDPKFYQKAEKTNDISNQDYYIAKVTEESNLQSSSLKAMSYRQNRVISPSQHSIDLVENGAIYQFSTENDFDIITSFADDIVNYNLTYNVKLDARYSVLNYLAYILVKNDLELYYIGNSEPLKQLIQDLVSVKNKKLTQESIQEYLTPYLLRQARNKFDKIIQAMRKEVWKSL